MSASAAVIAEGVGTFALVFIGAGAVCMNHWSGGALGVLGIAVAHGAVFGAMIAALGRVSGGHFNPAVTVAMLSVNRTDRQTATAYVCSQLAGAASAALVLRLLLPSEVWRAARLGAPSITAVTVGQALVIEAVLTFFLVLAVFGAAGNSQGGGSAAAGWGIGAVLACGMLLGGPVTGAAMNPARAFGPALLGGALDHRHVVYWLGPILGGLAASWLSANVFFVKR
ncbi:MAG: aquaporin [Candidatus Omnitrophica bacterium]|nr:aquaporin [Candidatus Omnitrophota bacterium]